MRSDEKTCYACNAAAPSSRHASNASQRVAGILTVLFFLSLCVLVASLVTDLTPPFSMCAGASLVLMLARKSVKQMADPANR